MPAARFTICVAMLLAAATDSQAQPQSTVEPTLSSELKTLADGFAKRAPLTMRRAFAKGIADVEATGILQKALAVGQPAPDGTLVSPDGNEVSFASLHADRPLVAAFYRGGWCPYCNTQLRALQRSLAAIESAGGRLVAIAPERPEKVQETVAKNELTLTVLTDRGNELAKGFGIAFTLPPSILPIYQKRIGLAEYNGDSRNELPLAATYVIGVDGVIKYAFVDADYKKRAEPADVVAALQKLMDPAQAR